MCQGMSRDSTLAHALRNSSCGRVQRDSSFQDHWWVDWVHNNSPNLFLFLNSHRLQTHWFCHGQAWCCLLRNGCSRILLIDRRNFLWWKVALFKLYLLKIKKYNSTVESLSLKEIIQTLCLKIISLLFWFSNFYVSKFNFYLDLVKF